MSHKIRYNNRWFFGYGDGYFRNGKTTLHRYKYEKKHGAILHCFHLHHRDGNKFNNSLRNLQLMTPQEHAHLHKTLRRTAQFQNQLRFEWNGRTLM
ncbi:MAG: HNH endonuclease [Holosporaceae bacterium]|nr:HNH endonuclease [Holosporaceae bacterium]